MNKTEYNSYLSGVRCDVLGLGISNRPLIRLLLDGGASVTIRDKKERAALGNICDELEARGARFVLGDGYLDGIDTDVIFRSPGIRPDTPQIAEAVASGAHLSSEMDLFLATTKADVIAITGSDGKTTTTTLTHLFLKAQREKDNLGRVYVGGNIGTPLLEFASAMTSEDTAVLELSSFQLMSAKPNASRAAITNLSLNHLNWHTNFEEYVDAKLNIFAQNTHAVLNADNEYTYRIACERGSNMTLFSSAKDSYEYIVGDRFANTSAIFARDGYVIWSDGKEENSILRVCDIKLPGKHNLENYMTAIALTYGLVDKEIYSEVARSFGGVPHRLELVRELDGVRYYNSSIDSTPTRTAAALSALEGTKIVICGGCDKGVPFDTLADALCKSAKAVVLTGDTRDKIKQAIEECPSYKSSGLRVIVAPLFADAVRSAREAADKGDAVLLSPACASFDAFSNFEERGDTFKKLVSELPECDKN